MRSAGSSSARRPARQHDAATDLLEMVAQFDNGSRVEHPAGIQDQSSVFQGIDVAFDQEQIGAVLHGKESAARHVDTVRVLEVLDRSSRRSLQL